MRTYEDLTFYRDMYALARELYAVLPAFPKEERYGLAIQIRTSCVSCLSNIAEGSGRATDGEYANSVSNASGSAAELDCQLKLSRDLGFLPAKEVGSWLLRLDSIRRRTRRFHETLKTAPSTRKHARTHPAAGQR